ncbi:hypothetical protein OHC33_007610 [Knufia fluminis]|uniref:F-box domain-containing protein n=1 Tax=Knufia fluminis TaxID=191047 RepID=A0AAN8EHX4_9EURO|nr:hypothetical protein OHC33_007610 [Knufia fluminis]
MTRKERTAWRREQKFALAHRVEINDEAMVSGKSLLSLPTEIRDKIFDHLVLHGGEIVVTKKSCLWSLASRSHIFKLREVCRSFRHHIDSHVYRTSHVQFKTKEAVKLWAEEFPDRLNCMRRATFSQKSFCPTVLAPASSFRDLRHLTVRGLDLYGWIVWRPFTEFAEYVKAQPLVEYNPYQLAKWRLVEMVIEALPQFREGVVLPGDPYKWRDPYLTFLTRDSKTSAPYDATIVDAALVTSVIDQVIMQMRDGRCEPSYPEPGRENYTSFEDFVKRGLGRGRLLEREEQNPQSILSF